MKNVLSGAEEEPPFFPLFSKGCGERFFCLSFFEVLFFFFWFSPVVNVVDVSLLFLASSHRTPPLDHGSIHPSSMDDFPRRQFPPCLRGRSGFPPSCFLSTQNGRSFPLALSLLPCAGSEAAFFFGKSSPLCASRQIL